MKAVKFLAATTVGALYNEGEIAGFEDEVADKLIADGFAEAVKPSKADAKAEAEAKAKAEADAKAEAEAKEAAEAEAKAKAEADAAAKEKAKS